MVNQDKMTEAEVSLILAVYLLKNKLVSSDVSVALDGAQIKTGATVHFPIYDKKTGPIIASQLKEQAKVIGLQKYDRVVVVAGKNYAKYIEVSLTGVKEFIYPLQGRRGMGYMM